MEKITSRFLRKKFLKFFENRGHAVIKSASLIPENDPSVLFTTAGMHPLIPYLLGQSHPSGTRLADVQKCVRTGDIDEVGDASHCTFFEMLGNWSLGDYFKEQSIKWSFEFLTSDEYLGLDANRLAVSVFEGRRAARRGVGKDMARMRFEGRADFFPAEEKQLVDCGYYGTLRPRY